MMMLIMIIIIIIVIIVVIITKRQILDYSEPKEFADDNFELDENGKKFSKRVENTVRKGEISPIPSLLKSHVLQTLKKTELVWERANALQHNPMF